MAKYNGWTNKETWLVNVHQNPESIADVNYLEETLEDEFYDLLEDVGGSCSVYADLIHFSRINWDEIRSHFKE